MDETIKTDKTAEESGPILDAAIAIGALMIVGTICALILHWAGLL